MWRLLLASAAAMSLFAAGDPWDKVRELKSGTELRIYKRNVPQPVMAKMDDVNDENLLVVVKNEQAAIPKSEIDRVDYRPNKSRVTKETKVKQTDPDTRPAPPGQGRLSPGSEMSSGVTVGSKADFETIYDRAKQAPPKK